MQLFGRRVSGTDGRGLASVDWWFHDFAGRPATLKAVVVEEQRRGFWKAHDRLRAQGCRWNHKRIWRVYCLLHLNLPRRAKRRVPQRARQPLFVEPRMNAVWAPEFMRDTLYSGKVFRALNVIDEANRGGRGIDVATSIPATRVIAFLGLWANSTAGRARFAATTARS